MINEGTPRVSVQHAPWAFPQEMPNPPCGYCGHLKSNHWFYGDTWGCANEDCDCRDYVTASTNAKSLSASHPVTKKKT